MIELAKPLRNEKRLVTFYGTEGGSNGNCYSCNSGNCSCPTNTNCGEDCNCGGGGGDVVDYIVSGIVGGVVGVVVGAAFTLNETPEDEHSC